MQQDRDIEKDIRNVPAYISESSASYVSDVEEGEEPQNLLQFTKMQEVKNLLLKCRKQKIQQRKSEISVVMRKAEKKTFVK